MLNTLSSPSSISENAERELIVERVRRYGTSFSDAVLDPLNTLFTVPSIDGLIGYRLCRSYAVVYGDPISALSNRAALTQAFQTFCKEKKLRIISQPLLSQQRFITL